MPENATAIPSTHMCPECGLCLSLEVFFFFPVCSPMLFAASSPSAKKRLWHLTSPLPSAADPPHDGTDIPGQVPAAGGGGKIFLGVQPVRVNHEVSISQVA